MFHFMNFVRPFVNYAIFRELCDRMRFEVDCAKSHHRVISEGLNICQLGLFSPCLEKTRLWKPLVKFIKVNEHAVLSTTINK